MKFFVKKTIKEFLNEDLKLDLSEFLSNKEFVNKDSKVFLFHGTNISPEYFNLRDDYDWEDSNTWSGDLPEGHLFLTTDIKEASAYGKFVIPCELKYFDALIFKINKDNPSQVFDEDYGISLYAPDEYFRFWQKFEESGKSSLQIKGITKSTIITYIENVIPRVELAKEFYNMI